MSEGKGGAVASLLRCGFGRCVGFLGRVTRAILGALGLYVAVDELDHAHRAAIPVAETRLQNPGVAAGAIRVTRPDHGKQLLNRADVADFRDRLAARVKAALLAERDQALDD